MKKNKILLLAIPLYLVLASCKKEHPAVAEQPKTTIGVYVLNQGTPFQDNTSLTFYNIATRIAATDIFSSTNNSKLGRAGTDLLIYGSKMYIVMDISSYVAVADAATAKSLATIDFKKPDGTVRLPRNALAYKNKVFISSYEGTVAVIDTTSLTIDKFITVGGSPQQMAISGNKLFVTNTGTLNQLVDSAVSIVDLASLTETNKITVGANPGSITADDAGNVYVACSGDYGAGKPSLVKINAAAGAVTASTNTAAGRIQFFNGLLYVTGTANTGTTGVRTLNTTDFKETSGSFVTDGTIIKQPSGLTIDPETGDVYITDAIDYSSSGAVYCFNKNGTKKFSFSVDPGVTPNTVVLVRK